MRSLFCGFIGAVVGLAMFATTAPAALPEGWVISIQQTTRPTDPPDRDAPGMLVRYDIHDGKVAPAKPLCARHDVIAAVISPDGSHIACIREDHSIHVMDASGGQSRQLLKSDAAAEVVWPAGDAGEWIYFLDSDTFGRARLLRRVSSLSGVEADVASFNMTVRSLSLARNANVHSGRLAVMPAENWPGVAGYDLSHGHGDLFRRLIDADSRWPAVSIDGETIASITPDRAKLRLTDWNGRLRRTIACPGGARFIRVRWSANGADELLADVARDGENATAHVDHSNIYLIHATSGAIEIEQVTQNRAGAIDRSQDLFLTGGNDFGMGTFEGEAPFTIRMPGEQFSSGWVWDWGDGGAAAAGDGSHTYADAGLYDIAGTRGNQTRTGRANVLDRMPPQVVATEAIDATHVLVHFSEAVRITKGIDSIPPGGVASYKLDANGHSLCIVLNASARWPIEFDLAGVQDCAQEPQALVKTRATLSDRPPDWTAASLWVWGGADSINASWDAPHAEPAFARVLRQGAARFTRHGAMRCGEGTFVAASTGGTALPAGPLESFSVRLLFRPLGLLADDQEKTIARFGGGQQAVDLLQRGGTVRLRVTRGDAKQAAVDAPLATLPPTGYCDLVLSFDRGHWLAYRDGEPSADFKTDLQSLALGSAIEFSPIIGKAGDTWNGVIEQCAALGRAADASDAKRFEQAGDRLLAERPKLATFELEAKLLSSTIVPRPIAIAPYRDALVAYEYEVTRQIAGEPVRGKIRVAHFGLLNAEPTRVAQRRVGEVYRLNVERFTDRPDLVNTFLADTLSPDFDQVLYVDAD